MRQNKLNIIQKIFCTLLTAAIILFACGISASSAEDYGRKLSKAERESICSEIQAGALASPARVKSIGGGIIPDSVMLSIFNTTKEISDASSFVLVLGHALTCHAVGPGAKSATILGVTLFRIPNLSVWLCGAVIYFFGFMLTLSITFYLVDIAFKLGFAIIMLPIGVALWPFPATKDKLSALISIMLRSAAIFVFLALGVSYALNLIGASGGGLEEIFADIDNDKTDEVAENFSLASTHFLIVLFTLLYSMKLVGSVVADYADKFFPDQTFGKASPIHGSMTQGMDFVKKKAVQPAAMWAGDVARTQMGRATVGAGKLLSGEYNQQIKKAAYYASHPLTAAEQAGRKTAKFTTGIGAGIARGANSAVVGGLGRVVLGKKASAELKNSLRGRIDSVQDKVDGWADKNDEAIDTAAGNSKFSKVAHEAHEKFDNFDKKYTTVFDKLNKATDAIDNVKSRINNPVNNAVNKINNGINEAFADNVDDNGIEALGKAAIRATLKAQVSLAGGILKAPAALTATAVKAPVVAAKGAAHLLHIKGAANATGNLLKSVGDKMQRNKSSAQQRAARQAEWNAEQEADEALEKIKREKEEYANWTNIK